MTLPLPSVFLTLFPSCRVFLPPAPEFCYFIAHLITSPGLLMPPRLTVVVPVASPPRPKDIRQKIQRRGFELLPGGLTDGDRHSRLE